MILLMGPTGSGKSTQGKLLARQYGMRWVSVGQLLHGHLDDQTRSDYDQGNLVATELAVDVLDKLLATVPPDQQILLDGMPRNEEQLAALDRLLAAHGRTLEKVIYLSVPEQEIHRRLKLRDRADDPAVSNKLSIFKTVTLPIIDTYRERGLTSEVDGVGSVDVVFARLVEVISESN